MASVLVETTPANNTSWVKMIELPKDLPEESDEVSGKLQGIGVVAGHSDNHRIRITLDRSTNPIVSDKLTSSFNEYGNSGMTLNIPFDKSIKIDIKDEFHPRSRPRFWASIVLDT